MGVHHKIVLKNDIEITSVKQLKEMIRIARKRILNDSSLRKFFDSITKEIDKNAELCGLIQILELHPEWIPELVDYDGFRKKSGMVIYHILKLNPFLNHILKLTMRTKVVCWKDYQKQARNRSVGRGLLSYTIRAFMYQ